jgi:hypothetical protein
LFVAVMSPEEEGREREEGQQCEDTDDNTSDGAAREII